MNAPWPKQIRQKFPTTEALVEFAFPDGSELECKSCNLSRPCTKQEIVKFIKDGYPVCRKCGQKVELANPWKK